ncbi:ABC transporter permease [Bradyrhizobium elkanii]|uniref:ABC transporter permease n=1 Tax=Bradyrhizobium elkanii TaxID=29448 RepID=UPI0020A19948|nr:hypothetical protein [Bradyrhizobium elkanii]MCP1972711.1 hypothetical protein [Bradyrhizobium elkanii]MCS3519907.1 hypothetical protein [Bradyrhizobium elkanii]MCS4067562.1 hypothetical protein [Bradyrhizobium elkanii]MCS4083098.1 hypothetical protein [Bradyrhizobium elkanii]MCS4105781.1 hypothetical protein [Bradyrhizobium elkanii]
MEPRIVREVIVDWPASPQPVSARMVSLNRAGDETLARLHLRGGAAPEPGSAKSAAVNEAFAEANRVSPGDAIRVLLNGKVEAFHVSGVALSPEYVYAVKPGLPIPDDPLYAILWVDRSAAEAAFAMKAAFNDAVISLAPGTDPKPVIDELDRLLEPYGSVGAVERRDQPSNRFLEDELNQQKVMSITIPFIFFGVAAFLLNSALGRLVTAQREQIAALKPLGISKCRFDPALSEADPRYRAGRIGARDCSRLGLWKSDDLKLSRILSSARAAVRAHPLVGSAGHCDQPDRGFSRRLDRIAAGGPPCAGGRDAAGCSPWLPPLLDRSAFATHCDQISPVDDPAEYAGCPFRSLLTVTGVAFAIPMMVLGISWRDAINEMIDLQFSLVERGNTTVTFPHPMDRSIIRDLARELSRPGNEHAHHGPPYRDRRRCSGCRCGDGLAVGPGAGGGRDRCGDEGTVHRHRR